MKCVRATICVVVSWRPPRWMTSKLDCATDDRESGTRTAVVETLHCGTVTADLQTWWCAGQWACREELAGLALGWGKLVCQAASKSTLQCSRFGYLWAAGMRSHRNVRGWAADEIVECLDEQSERAEKAEMALAVRRTRARYMRARVVCRAMTSCWASGR